MKEVKIGILDPEGKKPNPMNGEKYREIYTEKPEIQQEHGINNYKWLSMGKAQKPGEDGWTSLKVWGKAEEIIGQIRDHQVLVIESGTGTGKTVILPKLALHAIGYKGNVVVTVPKTSLASSSAGFAAKCLDVVLGEEVGFQHRGAGIDAKLSSEGEVLEEAREAKSSKTKLLFSTDGLLRAQMSSDPLMKKYNVVMIDEVHERNASIDLLILSLREALLVNKNLKVIITSATMDPELFINYFREKGISVASNAVSFGENKPVKLEYHGAGVNKNNVSQKSVDLFFKKIVKPNLIGDTIIFANSEADGKKICQMIAKLDKSILCYVVTAITLGRDENLEENAKNDQSFLDKGYTRKVLISTDVWESSITLPNIIYVIDSGRTLSAGYNGDKMEYYLLNKFIAKSQANQRKGRAGRVYPGFCYRMYNESDYNAMLDSKPIKMAIDDFTEQLVELWNKAGVETLEQVIMMVREMLTKPSQINVKASLKTLQMLEITNGFMGRRTELTDLGLFLSKTNKANDIRLAKSLYYAKLYDCFFDVVAISSMLSSTKKGISDIFISDKEVDKKELSSYKRELGRYKNKYGDMMAGLRVIKDFMDTEFRENRDYNKVRNWCRTRYIHYKNTKTIADQASSISYFKRIESLELTEEENFDFKSKEDKIVFCLLKGLMGNLAVSKSGKYENIFPDIKTKTSFQSDFLTGSGGKYIIYWKLMQFDSDSKFTSIMNVPEYLVDYLTDYEKEMVGL
jgi:HrpA-like RNA helicase